MRGHGARSSASGALLVPVLLSALLVVPLPPVLPALPPTYLSPSVTPAPATWAKVWLNLSPSTGGTILLTNGSETLTAPQNLLIDVKAGFAYPIVAIAARGFQFQRWDTNGELVVADPNAAQTNVTIASGGTLTAEFVVPPPASSFPGLLWIVPVVGAATVVAVVVIMRRRPRVPTGSKVAATAVPRAPVASPPPAPGNEYEPD